jgi:hypothetical protein
MGTLIPAANAGSSRTETGLAPNSWAAAAESSGVSGGWSTYPKSRWRPARMKYISSGKKP